MIGRWTAQGYNFNRNNKKKSSKTKFFQNRFKVSLCKIVARGRCGVMDRIGLTVQECWGAGVLRRWGGAGVLGHLVGDLRGLGVDERCNF